MEGLLFGLAENLLIKVSRKVFQGVSSAYGVRNDLNELATTISTIKAVISDAEAKKIHNNEVRVWLEQLKGVLYDTEDVFDEFEYEELRRKLKNQSRTSKKVIHYFSMQLINSGIFNFKIALRIKKIRSRLDEIDSQRKKFHLVENEVEYFPHPVRETHSFIHESEALKVIGRGEDKKRIIQLLINSNDDEELSVISVVGMGGLGKTTLAKLVYNDQRIKKYFEKEMWICVSEDFDVRRLTREILSSTSDSEISKDFTLEELQNRLRNKLAGKRFLLVLDDVWNEDVNKWRDLRQFLMEGAKGSKILVTTRTNLVADVMSSDEKYELREISEEESWSLFAKYAFENGKEKEIPENLKRIGKAILKKCKGVPLAIKSLGSLLYSKRSVREWEYIRDSEIWKFEDEKVNEILPALKLSYDLMPSYLKPCFVYCTLFPKDYVYSYDRLIQLWMAQGLLFSKNESDELEDIGERYLRELCSRSFFQDFESNALYFDYGFKMHDLIHDLGLSIAQSRHFTVDLATNCIPEKAAHLYILDMNNNGWSQVQTSNKVRSLAFSYDSWSYSHLIEEHFKAFKSLRVLELEGASIMTLPDSIGRLNHLRYLSLRGSGIIHLSNSICELLSLQTLILENCEGLRKLPIGIKNMISLRCLWITGKQLKYLLQPEVECLSNLRFLAISTAGDLFSEDDCDQMVIPSKLQILYLKNLGWRSLPKWFRSFAKTLRELRIVNLPCLESLPRWLLKLSSLETLDIIGCSSLTSLPQGMENLTSLTKLGISDCGELSERFHQQTSDDRRMVADVSKVAIDFLSMDKLYMHHFQ